MIKKTIVLICAFVSMTVLFSTLASATYFSDHQETSSCDWIIDEPVTLQYEFSDTSTEPNRNGQVYVDVVLPNGTKVDLTTKNWATVQNNQAETILINWSYTPPMIGNYTVYYNNSYNSPTYDEVGSFRVYWTLSAHAEVTPVIVEQNEPVTLTYTLVGNGYSDTTCHITPIIQRPDGSTYNMIQKDVTFPPTNGSEESVTWTIYQIQSGKYEVVFDAVSNGFDVITDGFFVNFSGVVNLQPYAFAEADKVSAYVGQEVEFYGEGIDEDGYIVNYTWDIDGDTFYREEFTYEFYDEGIYIASLRVEDNDGAVDIDTVRIEVLPIVIEEDETQYLYFPLLFTVLGILFAWLYIDSRKEGALVKNEFLTNHMDTIAIIFFLIALVDFVTRIASDWILSWW